MADSSTPLPPRAYNLTQLAAMYQVSTDTMRSWINKIDLGERFGKIFTPKQVSKIFEHLGDPGK